MGLSTNIELPTMVHSCVPTMQHSYPRHPSAVSLFIPIGLWVLFFEFSCVIRRMHRRMQQQGEKLLSKQHENIQTHYNLYADGCLYRMRRCNSQKSKGTSYSAIVSI